MTSLPGGVTSVAGGHNHSLAVQNGNVYSWGYNAYGQLGDGTQVSHSLPTVLSGLSDIVQVAATFSSSYALASDGSLWVWGENNQGQLGLGDFSTRLTPT